MDTIVIISVILFVILFLFTSPIQCRRSREDEGEGKAGRDPILRGNHSQAGTRTHTLCV
jgi:heme/copper-type cytochrome/quinol oxidase subunit 2